MKDQQAKQQQQQAAAAAAAQEAQAPASKKPTTQEPKEAQASDSLQPAAQEPKESAAEEDQEKATAPDESEADESESESESESEDEEELYRMMIGKKVNESGFVIDKKSGSIIGRLVEGKVKKVTGRKVGERGAIVNSKGKILGRIEPVKEEESSEEESDSEEEEESGQEDEVSKAAESETEDVKDGAEEVTDKSVDEVDEVTDEATEKAGDAADEVGDAAEKAGDATDATEKAGDAADEAGEAADEAGDATDATEKAGDAADEVGDAIEKAGDSTGEAGEATEKAGDAAEKAREVTGEASDDTDKSSKVKDAALALSSVSATVRKSGKIFDSEDNLVGHVDKRLASKLSGYKVDNEGNVYDDEGEIVGTAEMIPQEEEDAPFNPNDAVDEDSPEVRNSGKIFDMDDNLVGHVDKRIAAKYAGCKVDPEGNVIDKDGEVVAKAEMIKPEVEKDAPFNPNEDVDEDSPEVRNSGKIFDMDDNLVGHVDKRIAAKYAGCKVDPEGNVINKDGEVVAKAEMIKPEVEKDAPFNPNEDVDEDSPEVRKSGKIFDMDDNLVGHVDKRIGAKYAGCKVDPEGNVIDKDGEVVATAEMIKQEESESESEEEEETPFNPNESVDENSPEVRKSGKVFDMDDNLVGHVDKSIASKYAGCKVNPEGNVIDKDGHIAGKAEMIKPEVEEDAPFNPNEDVDEDSPEVRKSGKIFDMDDNLVGHVDKRIGAKFAGCKVDPEGNVIDKDGHVVARGEMIQEEEKSFNPNQMVNADSPEVRKSGKVFDMDDNLVGHVDKSVASKYAGCKVDGEGNVINKDGDTVGKAEMIKPDSESEEEEEDKPYNPNLMVDEHSPEVRRSGKVVDEDDEIVGTVDKGSANQWAGFKVDSYGNVINQDGHTVGKADMLKQISDEERQQQEEDKQYRQIADSMSQAVQQSLDKIKPVLKQITDNIESEEAKSEKDRDEKKLVETVKPLIEQGSNILGEANGAIRGLDPSGKIAKQAQARTSERKALPEEYHLAELLSQLTGEVSTTIDKAKKKIKNMPHAKRELGPLWNILQSPLLQILSAVGLLLTGVLGLVGNILNGLGLGSIINSLLGGLGLNKILEGFGLGDALKLGKK